MKFKGKIILLKAEHILLYRVQGKGIAISNNWLCVEFIEIFMDFNI